MVGVCSFVFVKLEFIGLSGQFWIFGNSILSVFSYMDFGKSKSPGFVQFLNRKLEKSWIFVVPKSEIRKVLDFCRGDYPPPPPHRSGQTRRRVRRRFLRSLDCKPFCFVRLPCTLQKKQACSISKACEGIPLVLKNLCFPSLPCFSNKRKNREHPNKRGKGVKL